MVDVTKGQFVLRDYQQEAVDATYQAWQSGTDSVLVVLATGMGKTVVFCDIASRWSQYDGRVMVIAHRQELIDQAADKYQMYDGERPAIEMGNLSEIRSGHSLLDRTKVLVTSIQTLNSLGKCIICKGKGCSHCDGKGRRYRMYDFDPFDFGVLIYDEAHHAVSNSGLRAVQYFRKNPELKELYVTATPNRKDEIGMHNVADECVVNIGIKEGVDLGWLVPIRQKFVRVESLDFSKIKTTAGDLNSKQLAEVMGGGSDLDEEAVKRQEEMLHKIASPTIEEADGRSAIVFAVNLEQAERLTEIFNRHEGVTAEFVHGGTPKYERDELIERFKKGRTQILVNVGVATEGFDAPNVELVVMARPTKSVSLYIQCLGRGTRTLPGVVDGLETPEERQKAIAESDKPFMTVLDFVGNSGRHKLMSAIDVLAGEVAPEVVNELIEMAETDTDASDIQQLIKDRDELERKREEERKRRAAEEAARRARIKAEAKYNTEDVDPFGRTVAPHRDNCEFRGGASDKQVKLLEKLGVRRETAMSYNKRQAGAVITSLKSREGADYIIGFGKHSGKALKDVPSGYLRWIKENMDGGLGDEIRRNIEKMEA